MKCSVIDVPEEICYIRFEKKKSITTRAIGTTCRGEHVYADYDENGAITGLELVDETKKPCQRPVK